MGVDDRLDGAAEKVSVGSDDDMAGGVFFAESRQEKSPVARFLRDGRNPAFAE